MDRDIHDDHYRIFREDIVRGEWSLDQCTKKTAEEVVCPEGTFKFVGSKTVAEISDCLVRDGAAKRLNTKPVVIPPTKSARSINK